VIPYEKSTAIVMQHLVLPNTYIPKQKLLRTKM